MEMVSDDHEGGLTVQTLDGAITVFSSFLAIFVLLSIADLRMGWENLATNLIFSVLMAALCTVMLWAFGWLGHLIWTFGS